MSGGEEEMSAKTSADASERTAAPPAERGWRHRPPHSQEEVVHAPVQRPQRFRKPNYTEAEKRLIYSLLLPRLRVVENKSLDRRVLREKHLVWKEVTAHYNAAILASGNSLVVRDVDELRTFWKNARRKAQWREQIQAGELSSPAENIVSRCDRRREAMFSINKFSLGGISSTCGEIIHWKHARLLA
ncbi:hypothetical protein E2C01_018295 [Portunus trituberculatus]|uniref:Regulatory protein zeste n=1 Tax=Portunus trituberculatus TaxID=210409 RepID=A0A5B7DU52_PORTR|nr:hypothetical protein [Portunus trituberculatus]